MTPPLDDKRAKDFRHAARSGAVQVLTAIAQGVIAATQIVFARLYGASVLGTYQAALAVIEIAARAATGGADKAMLRYVPAGRAANEPESVRRALGSGLRTSLLVGGTVSIAVLVGAGGLSRLMTESSL